MPPEGTPATSGCSCTTRGWRSCRELAGGADRRARRHAAALRAVGLRRRRRRDGRAAARRATCRCWRTPRTCRGASGWPTWPTRTATRSRSPLPRRAGLAGRRGLGLALGLDQRRLAALGERDLDRVEVARHDRVREHRPRLVADLAREVARREVGQGEQPHAGVARRARPPGAAVEWPVSRARARSSSQNVASWTSTSAPWAKTSIAWHGARVAREHDPPARRALARRPAPAARRRPSRRAAGARSPGPRGRRARAPPRRRSGRAGRPPRTRSRRRSTRCSTGNAAIR